MIKTLTLDGLTSVKIKQSAFDMERFCWVKNRSDGDIFISCTDVECTENGDNVMKISAGEYGMIDSESREILYLNGSGKVEIVTSAYAVCPFKAASKGGGSYELPIATTEILGGVKVDGSTITVDGNGVIKAVGSGRTNYLIQYGVASSSFSGTVSITFPKTFATTPIVVVSPVYTRASSTPVAWVFQVSKNGFQADEAVYEPNYNNHGEFIAGNFNLHWIAIGGA